MRALGLGPRPLTIINAATFLVPYVVAIAVSLSAGLFVGVVVSAAVGVAREELLLLLLICVAVGLVGTVVVAAAGDREGQPQE